MFLFHFHIRFFSSSDFRIVEPYQLIEAEVNHVSNYLAQSLTLNLILLFARPSRDNIQNKHKPDCSLHFFCAYTELERESY